MSKIAKVSELITTDVDKKIKLFFQVRQKSIQTRKKNIKKVFEENLEFKEIILINRFVSEMDDPQRIKNFWNKLNLFATKADMNRKEFFKYN